MEIREYCSDKLEKIKFIDITNKGKSRLKLMNLGAAIVEIWVPDRNGLIENVVLTLDDEQNYLTDLSYFGATVGRTSGRIKNGKFVIDGIEYSLNKREEGYHHHGGTIGYSFAYFDYSIVRNEDSVIVDFVYNSYDMEEGYPGNVNLIVRYTFTDDNVLTINYIAISDRKTIMNFTNHSYFNLSGDYERTVLEHELSITSDRYLLTNIDMVPNGNISSVANSALDFNKSKSIGRDIGELYSCPENGYDHVWLFEDNRLLNLYCPDNGRKLEISTSYPSVVLYSHNYPSNSLLKNGKKQEKHMGLAIECQFEPNGINTDTLHTSIFDANIEYNQFVEYKFTVD